MTCRSLAGLLACSLASASLLGGCGKPAASGSGGGGAATGPILVGEVASLTGDRSSFGLSSHEGTQLALEELNAAGGLLGRPLELITEDDQSKKGEPATCAQKLLHGRKVSVLLGEVASSASLEMAPKAQAAKVPMISPASTNPAVTQEGDYVFRVCFIDSFQGTVMAKFAKDKLGARKVAILYDESQDYSVGLKDYFKKGFVAAGGQVAIERSFKSKDTDFSGALGAIGAEKPDAIFVPGYYTEVALIAKQARQAGLAVPLLGGDGWVSPSLTEVAGASIEDCFFCDHHVVEGFAPKFEARFKHAPDSMSALGYDSLMVYADAVKRAGTTEPAKVREALAATRGFAGASGTINMDAERNASKPAVVMRVKGGKYVPEAVIEP